MAHYNMVGDKLKPWYQIQLPVGCKFDNNQIKCLYNVLYEQIFNSFFLINDESCVLHCYLHFPYLRNGQSTEGVI